MTGGTGRDEEGLPVFDAVEAAAVEERRLASPGRGLHLGPAHGAGIAAAFLVLLVAGIAVGSLPKKADVSPSPSTTDRVITDDGPRVTDAPVVTPLPTPIATPTVACGSGSPSPELVVRLEGGLEAHVAGVPDTSGTPGLPQPAIPVVDVALGDQVLIAVDGDICAVSWDIELRDVEGSVPDGRIAYAVNLTEDPAIAAQNRWPVPPGGDQLLMANLHFAGGLDISRIWRVTVQPFPVPAPALVGPDGRRAAAFFSCGLQVALHNGYQSNDSCGGIRATPAQVALRVPAYRPVTFEVPGWSIRSWMASCGTIADFAFTVTDGCSLGGGAADNGGTLTSPIAFLVPPGDQVILVHADAVGPSGDQFSTDYFIHVIAR